LRLLLICLDNIGDLVFTSSLVGPLKAKYPDAKWTILCKDYAADVARSFDVDADVVAADPWWMKSPGRKAGSMLALVKAVLHCRAQRPEITIVTSVNWRAAAVARLVGSAKRVGFNRPKSWIFLTHRVSVVNWSKTPLSTSLSQLLPPCGVEINNDLTPPLSIKIKQVPVLAKPLPAQEFVVLHPFAGSLSRCWPLHNWGILAGEIRSRGFVVMWMGREDEAGKILKEIPESVRDGWMYQMNQGQLALSLYITSKAKGIIGNDSGPIHFAAALDVPVLGFYLPSLYPSTVSSGRAPRYLIHRASPADLQMDDVLLEVKKLLGPSSRA
jgi:ADP-heptose:LPS heptosyltransferase